MSRWDVLRLATNRAIALGVVALLLLVVGCGPLGDNDDDDEPTIIPAAGSPAAGATPSGGPVQSTRSAGAASPTAGQMGDDVSPAAGTAPPVTSTPRATEPPAETPQPTARPRTPTPPSVSGCEDPAELPEARGGGEGTIAEEADEGVNLRAAPGEECDILTTLQPGAEVVVESGEVESDDLLWVKVSVGDTEGWMASQFLDLADEDDADA